MFCTEICTGGVKNRHMVSVFHSLTLEGPCIIFCNIHTFQRDTQCSCTDCLLILSCQLYMFRTVTVHPQELLFRCCMCRLWYVLIHPVGTTFEEEQFFLKRCTSTYHSLHIQRLKRSSWGWTVTVRNMYSWHLSINKQSMQLHCVSRWNVYILQKMIHGPSSVKFTLHISLLQ